MRNLIFILMILSCELSANEGTFDKTFKRYLTGHELYISLGDKFPNGHIDNSYNCNPRDFEIRKALGFSNPLTGRPYDIKPSSAFIKFIDTCGQDIVIQDLRAIVMDHKTEGIPRYIPGDAFPIVFIESARWSHLPQEYQLQIIRHRIDQIIGLERLSPERTEELVHLLEKTASQPLSSTLGWDELPNKLLWMTMALLNQEEFLTY